MAEESLQTLQQPKGDLMFTLSQNARRALSTLGQIRPIDLHMSSIAEDRAPLKEIIGKARKRGAVPFSHPRLEEIVTRYGNGDLIVPGVGTWVLVTDRWEDGVFTLEFRLPPPVPQTPVLVSVNYSEEVVHPFGLNHQFLFNKE